MPVRGLRPTMPKKPMSPSGIFSTNGSQKHDTVSAPGESVMNYAKTIHGKVNPKKRDNRIKK